MNFLLGSRIHTLNREFRSNFQLLHVSSFVFGPTRAFLLLCCLFAIGVGCYLLPLFYPARRVCLTPTVHLVAHISKTTRRRHSGRRLLSGRFAAEELFRALD